MMMLQLYYPGSAQPPAELSLSPNGRLRIVAPPDDLDRGALAPLLAPLLAALIQQPPTGHAIHYAGTLPMRAEPAAYQCDPDGRLHGTRRVFVADSASFPTLPVKNMSFGMMAGMRVLGASSHGAAAAPYARVYPASLGATLLPALANDADAYRVNLQSR